MNDREKSIFKSCDILIETYDKQIWKIKESLNVLNILNHKIVVFMEELKRLQERKESEVN